MEKTLALKDSDRYYCMHTLRRATKGLPFADEKNPARAYTLSLLLWGGGQSYIGQRWKAVSFRALMLLFFGGMAFALMNGDSLLSLLQSYGISRARAFLGAELLFFSLLLFWKYNAGDAYHAAAKARRIPFQGIQSRVLPLICSLLVPGWGQFVNGQPVKGSIFAGFAVFGFFSLLTVPATFFCWPSFEISEARVIIEALFAACCLYLPAVPLVWILSSYDALKVSINDRKKESIVDRILFAINLFRIKGWIMIFSRLRSLLILALAAAACAAVIHRYVPVGYAADHLASVQILLQKYGMTLVPDIIEKLLTAIRL